MLREMQGFSGPYGHPYHQYVVQLEQISDYNSRVLSPEANNSIDFGAQQSRFKIEPPPPYDQVKKKIFIYLKFFLGYFKMSIIKFKLFST